MSISNNERALIVVSNLTTHGRDDLRWLYRFIEISGTALTDLILRPRYKIYHKLVQEKATSQAFLEAIRNVSAQPFIKAIDVILMLHGLEDELSFADGAISSLALARQIAALNVGDKLRMLYSTTCYGKSHALDFVAAGFTSACGSLATNANAATEFPTVLTMWAAGSSLKKAIAAGDTSLTRRVQDRAARSMGFDDADSTKEIVGCCEITIRSEVEG
jgi:hypothetical protein